MTILKAELIAVVNETLNRKYAVLCCPNPEATSQINLNSRAFL